MVTLKQFENLKFTAITDRLTKKAEYKLEVGAVWVWFSARFVFGVLLNLAAIWNYEHSGLSEDMTQYNIFHKAIKLKTKNWIKHLHHTRLRFAISCMFQTLKLSPDTQYLQGYIGHRAGPHMAVTRRIPNLPKYNIYHSGCHQPL